VELDVRRVGPPAELLIRLYDVNDTDPTVDPESVELHADRVALPDSAEGEWQRVAVDVTQLISNRYVGVRPEALLLSVVTPDDGSEIDIDEVRLLEWRPLAELPDGAWIEADAVRGDPSSEVVLRRRGCR
jgi:hypothetical protein